MSTFALCIIIIVGACVGMASEAWGVTESAAFWWIGCTTGFLALLGALLIEEAGL